MKTRVLILAVLFKFSLCRDFYVGMFKKNDLLVAQDTLYKEKHYFGVTTAKYGRVFNCPITYFRVADRLGVGRPPTVTVNRGGLQKKYITLILTSSYNMPIAVNIYIGCENKMTKKTTTATTTKKKDEKEEDATTAVPENEDKDKNEDNKEEETTPAADAGGGDETTVAEEPNANGDETTPAADAGAETPAGEETAAPAEDG